MKEHKNIKVLLHNILLIQNQKHWEYSHHHYYQILNIIFFFFKFEQNLFDFIKSMNIIANKEIIKINEINNFNFETKLGIFGILFLRRFDSLYLSIFYLI